MNRVMSSYILTPSISTSPSGKCKWQAVKAGTNAAMYRNPAYQGYQDTISLLGNKSNGLLTKPNANGGGVTPKETLQNLNTAQPAPTATKIISDTTNSIKNTSSVLANGIATTLSGLDKKIRK